MRRLVALLAILPAFAPLSAWPAEVTELPRVEFSFEGLFARYDRPAARRGFEVYSQSCAFCHGLRFVAFHNLADLGYSEAEIVAFAAKREIADGPNDAGEMFKRPGRISDHFPLPFPNDKAARAANGGALPPDLSLIVKGRTSGPQHVFGILTGYEEPAAGFALQPGLHYNRYFPGNQIAMPPPLTEGAVAYADGTEASLRQMAHDVTTFLAWASEPTLEERKRVGLRVMLFLIVFAALVFALKQRIWARLH